MNKKVDMALEESETIINYCRIEDWAEVYTSDKNVMKRYEKFSKNHPDYCEIVHEDIYSMTFHVHPKCASLYPKAPRKVVMTDEKKELLREHMKNIRTKQAV